MVFLKKTILTITLNSQFSSSQLLICSFIFNNRYFTQKKSVTVQQGKAVKLNFALERIHR